MPKMDAKTRQKAAKSRTAAKGTLDPEPVHVPQSTTDRIIEASLRLFNEHGFRNVPALKIAMHLGISPGHLAYHFKSKNDIVAAVFPQLEKEVRDAKKPGGPFLPSEAVHHQINVFRTLWRYRFFFNALTQLLPDEPDLAERFTTLQEVVIGAMRDLFDELISQGYMRPVEPNNTYTMGRCCWMMWLSWLRFEHIAHPRNEEPSDTALYEAVSLNSTIVGPYFAPQFSAMMEAELRKALPNSLPASSPVSLKRSTRTTAAAKGVRRSRSAN
jgi:AcrR family transcriptional regulator